MAEAIPFTKPDRATRGNSVMNVDMYPGLTSLALAATLFAGT